LNFPSFTMLYTISGCKHLLYSFDESKVLCSWFWCESAVMVDDSRQALGRKRDDNVLLLFVSPWGLFVFQHSMHYYSNSLDKGIRNGFKCIRNRMLHLVLAFAS
jgi:hypothetical protein